MFKHFVETIESKYENSWLPSFLGVYHPTTRGVKWGNYSKMSKMMFKHFVQTIESKYENSWLPSFFEVYHPTIGGVEEEITQKCPK